MFSSSSRRKKVHDRDVPPTSRDQRERDRDKDRERERSHRSAKTRSKTSSSSSNKDRDRESSRREKTYRTVSHSSNSTKMASVVPEMQRRASTNSPERARPSAYPTFSKEHSKEAVGSREDVVNPRLSLYTPNTTDLGRGGESKEAGPRPATTGAAPPSPPLTAASDFRRPSSANHMRTHPKVRVVTPEKRGSLDSGERRRGLRDSTSNSSLPPNATRGRSSSASGMTRSSKSSTVRESATATDTHVTSEVTQTTDSDATSIAPPRVASAKLKPAVEDASSPASALDSSPRTPTALETSFPHSPQAQKGTPMVEVLGSTDVSPNSPHPMPFNTPGPPPPPPPPPPPVMPQNVPRVDYLLQNGGLQHVVPRSLLAGLSPIATLVGQQQIGINRPPAMSPSVQSIFSPLNTVLDSYTQVMNRSGSIAVATGYRSVARRLLDRLEAVFARNISSETCACIMCESAPRSPVNPDEDSGVSWGEILEYVSGRRELPPWPPFSISGNSTGLGISGAEAPMQKLDIDVPEEYRAHYIRQSKKTKSAVQHWLASQPEIASSPPQEVDDETLTFAILTHLEPGNRPLFHALLRGMSTLPASRAPTPLNAPKGEMIPKTALALQRLYRLGNLPRDPESTIYLLQNPHMHAVLATIAAVSPHEWEILVSGRFDGFLWSGADPLSPISPRGPMQTPLSRTTTPYSPNKVAPASRGPTPYNGRTATPGGNGNGASQSSFGAPVQLDEETEIAALAEVEREIYAGMEALEDAFEALHNKAEIVRTALRERSAGLAAAAQARRGSNANIEVRLGTPGSMASGWGGMGWEGDGDGISVLDFDDGRSEIAPDDSASNVGWSNKERRRGRASRRERRTPAPVEEESGGESEVTEETPRRARRK